MAVQLRRQTAVGVVNLTPLIDCVFLLLIFFLVASRIADEEPQLDLDLPDVSEALPAMFQPEELVISINAEGAFFMQGEFRPIEQVEEILRRAHTNNPLNQSVVIRADRSADWEKVAMAISLCKQIGIQQYSATMEEQ